MKSIPELFISVSRFWKAPFRYQGEGATIVDASGHRLLDVRGWGLLTGSGSEAHGLDDGAATLIQDQVGLAIVLWLNANWPGQRDVFSGEPMLAWHKPTRTVVEVVEHANIGSGWTVRSRGAAGAMFGVGEDDILMLP